MVDEIKIKHVYRTTDEIFLIVKLFKIHSGTKTYNDCLDKLIILGWNAYKEQEEQNGKDIL